MKTFRKTSQIIKDIIAGCEDDASITVKEFLGRMGQRAQAIAIFVLAAATLVAGAIPGFSTIAAVPIIFIALQMLVARKSVWLPKKISEKQISAALISSSLKKVLPALTSIERLLRPRLSFLTSGISQRLIAALILVLSVVLAMPIPGGNLLPSMAITLLGLAILERDGVLLLITITLLGFTAHLMLSLIVQTVRYIDTFF